MRPTEQNKGDDVATRMLGRAGGRVGRAAVLAALWLVAVVPATAQAAPTVVSLTFDDGRANAYPARSILSSHGMHGTFYLNSGGLSADSYYMTWEQVAGLAADGNEIGGHTVDHAVLTSLTTDQAMHEVCDDRATLQAHGYNPVSFAYPEIAYNASVQQIVRDCGYSSARAGDASYPPAESLPPADPYAIRTVPAIESKTTLAQMQGYVTSVESSGGGWVVFMFHSVCTNCGTTLAVSPTNLSALLDWLAPRSANGTVVKTVGEVMGAGSGPDTTPPTSSIACNGSACGSWYSGPVTVSLSASDFGSGVAGIRYTTDGSDPSLTGTDYTGPFPLSSTSTVRWYATDVAGNAEAARSKTVGIDTVAPDVSWLTPADGATLARGNISLTASASDGESGVARVEFYVDGALKGTDTTAPYGITWSARKRGTHTLRTVATDLVGRTASATRTVTVG
jgi:peptidoglycan/xylan/chitin deacetylase (PgdA/CDA1 family)